MKFIQITQIIIAILLMLAILLQNRGTGLSGIFGGGGDVYRAKRGIEKILFTATIILAIIFFSTAIVGILI